MTGPWRGHALARHIDISCVQASDRSGDIAELARVAQAHGFVAAHVLPHFVPLLRENLGPDSAVLIGAPIGFPSGGATTVVKLAEARELVAMGARELDLMINVGRLKSGEDAYVRREIQMVVQAIAPLPLKVLLEVALLSDDEIRRACGLAIEAGAAFVKTGTGWAAPVPLLPRVEVIARAVQGEIGIKASGGIRDLAMIDALADLGVTRFGINARVAVALVAAG